MFSLISLKITLKCSLLDSAWHESFLCFVWYYSTWTIILLYTLLPEPLYLYTLAYALCQVQTWPCISIHACWESVYSYDNTYIIGTQPIHPYQVINMYMNNNVLLNFDEKKLSPWWHKKALISLLHIIQLLSRVVSQ